MPDRRGNDDARGQAAGLAVLAVAIVALLAAGIVGVAIHHRASSALPAGFQRLSDPADHLSLAVPAGWRVPVAASADSPRNLLQGIKASNPKLAALADVALALLAQVHFGLFAVDPSTKETLFAYGIVDPQLKTLDQISSDQINPRLQALGATVSRIHLRIGAAVQVVAHLTLGAATFSEVIDFLLRDGRLVSIVLITPGAQVSLTLLHQIQGTLQAV